MAMNSLHPHADSAQPSDLAARRRTAFLENELARIACSTVTSDCEQPTRAGSGDFRGAGDFLNLVDDTRGSADAATYFENMLHYAITVRLKRNIHLIAGQPAPSAA